MTQIIFDIPKADRKIALWKYLLPLSWFDPEGLVKPDSVSHQRIVKLKGSGLRLYASWAENYPGEVFITVFADTKD